MIKKGQCFLLLKLGNTPGIDCIMEHRKIIEKYGYCWLGKAGKISSQKNIMWVLKEDNPILLIYINRELYICRLTDVSTEVPTEAVPSYYEEYLYEQCIFPNMYFRITSIDEYDITNLEKYTVVSTGNNVGAILPRCMASSIFAEYKDDNIIRDYGKGIKLKQRELLDKNDCIYRKFNKCTLKTCINFQYECDRPSTCAKQKR